MNTPNKAQSQLSPQREIIGHNLVDTARFAEDTRHMIVFDVLTAKCPVGDVGDRCRVFLSEAGYRDALESRHRGEMKIVSHARVRRGELHYDSQYESEL
jgi:hypothetical protein